MKTRHHQKRQQRRRDGFTLLEVLLVLAILGVIAAMVVPNLIGTQEVANKNQTKINIKSLESTINRYVLDHDGTYPESIDQLLSPVDRDGNTMPPYLTDMIEDAWGRPLNYQPPEGPDERGIYNPRIWSNGVNGQNDDGSGDDINNWDKKEAE